MSSNFHGSAIVQSGAEIHVMNQLYGKVVDIREFKWGGFIILNAFREDGMEYQCIFNGAMPNGLKINSWVIITFELKRDVDIKRKNTVSDCELVIKAMDIHSSPEVALPILVNEAEPTFSLDNAFDHRGLSLQTSLYRDVFKKQSMIELAFNAFFVSQEGFISIHTPKIVASGAEGGTNLFSLDYFGKTAYLAQSPQLYKQICCAAFGKVCEVAPVFRAEKHNTSRHLNEYISLDVEMVLMPKVGHSVGPLYQLIQKEFEFLHLLKEGFQFQLLDNEPTVLTMKEAMEILGSNDMDFSSEQEQELGRWALDQCKTDLLFVTHYHRDVRPFYTKISDDGIHTESFDCIFKGVEITSGGQRADKYKDYIDAMNAKGIDPSNFSFYLDNFRYGFPVHGGFAIGLERLTAKLCDLPNTKMASLFPRDIDRLTP